MGGKRILSDEQLAEMADLRERGWGIGRIAAHFTSGGTPISADAINWQCMRLGADAPPHLRGKHTQPSAPYRRDGNTCRPWSADEDKRLLDLEGKGTKINQIARQIGRANSSVRGRLLTLARRDARREEATA
ncbi:hypothetical protein M527_07165 [Sphingobium indicum IP26]|uniref:Uncharacterized protein n=1 Tax=Sphingobium indicum F2 TaxID=1450518 RepID=A0A8E0WT33_9SPHN|nr:MULTISPECIES: hypothetical protein [Sphingobium]EPR09896.1 hypothetical protein M527_07165 [Sphingobium indicum IP26]EQB05024.1 hypothetical protein L286_09680 [Sphingobium sp. HDIP04]KER36690.1 hypothetical protein AL00_09460 [Sphingobium indicum F2]